MKTYEYEWYTSSYVVYVHACLIQKTYGYKQRGVPYETQTF